MPFGVGCDEPRVAALSHHTAPGQRVPGARHADSRPSNPIIGAVRQRREARLVTPYAERCFYFVGHTTRPGVVVRTLYSVPPPVTYSVFMSSPPNAQFVTSSVGTPRNASNLPSGVNT